jgi:bifunctional ADP-heptose synthase (sugar kinase/adenylyltransferase)|tara:strand:- start:2827 stop:3744 length:918 start_codon:yes stop_codon:yes gene_type:complete
MSRVLVIGDYLDDRYRFYEQTRADPANSNAPVVVSTANVSVDGGAGNLVKNIESLCNSKVVFFHSKCLIKAPSFSIPAKTRYYIDNEFIFREDENDTIEHNDEIIDKFIEQIKEEDFVVISDYHKGTILPNDIKKILEHCNKFDYVKTFVDTNHIFEEHQNITWLKINNKTAFEKTGSYDKETAKIISEETLSNVIITKGESGFIAYIKDLNQTICYTKDDNKKFVDSIGAGDTYLAGFISSLLLNMGDLPSMIYADIVAHISTTKLGTLKEISKEEADKEYLSAETSLTDMEDVLYVHCSFNDD